MSNVSNRHTVVAFVAGESKPLSGQRLAKVGYKQTKAMSDKGEVAPPSICASVPMISEEQIRTHMDSLIPHVRNYLESVQDNVLRSLYESRKYELSSVSDEELCIAQCVAYLEAESSGGRITKEYLDAWFTANMAENLYVVIADKLGFVDMSTETGEEDGITLTEDQDEVIQKHLNGYKSLLLSLSGNKVSLDQKQINGLRRALELCAPDGDSVAQKLGNKLDVIEKDSKQLLVDLL